MEPYRLIVLGISTTDIQHFSDRAESAGHLIVGIANAVEQLHDLVKSIRPDIVVVIVDDSKSNYSRVAEICKSNGAALVGAVKSNSESLHPLLKILNAHALFPFETTIDGLELGLICAKLVVKEAAKLIEENLELKDTIETRKLVERAKGILMDRHKLSENDAFKRIHFQARNQNKKMKEIAESIITAAELI